MRVEDVLCFAVEVLDGLDGFVVGDALTLKVSLGAVQHVLIDGAEGARVLEVLEPLGDFLAGLLLVPLVIHLGGGGELIGEEPQQALKVAGDEDVHGWAEGFLDAGLGGLGLLLVLACLPETVENVVFVGGDDELLDGESHAQGEVAGEDVAKVAGGGDEADFVAELEVGGGLGEGEVGVEVVDDLGEDASPVDGVDGAKVERGVDVLVGEEDLEDILCFVSWGCC